MVRYYKINFKKMHFHYDMFLDILCDIYFAMKYLSFGSKGDFDD